MNLKALYLNLILVIYGVAGWSQPTERSPKINILCILVDDLGYGDLSIQGAQDLQTPHIDNLAQQGITLTNFYANSTVCSPSRASLLSGNYPDLVGVPGVIRQDPPSNWGYLARSAVLIPNLLNQQGYHTALIGKWHLGLESPNTPNERGFQYFKGFLGDMMDDYWTHLRGGKNWMRHNDQEIDPKGHATDLFTEWTVEYLSERKSQAQPFFLYLAYNAPHFPIQPPQSWLDQVEARSPELDEKRAKNVAFIEHLDHSIGLVMQTLKETGLIENTLVVFTSDNGGALRFAQSNDPLRGGKQDMYEGGIKVPAFAFWKDHITPGSTSDNFGMLMDLFPTFCEVAGFEAPQELPSVSLLPTLLGQEQATDDRTVFWVRREGWKYGGQCYYAAREGHFKILQNSPYEAIQYFNLEQDPFEQNPLEGQDDPVYNKLRAALQEHIRTTGAIAWQKPDP